MTPATIQKLATELATKYGESERSRIERGLNQAARFWRKEDGDEADFAEVAREQIAQDSAVRNALFSRMEFGLESLDGHMNEIARDFRRQSDLDLGADLPLRRDPRRLRPGGARQRRLLLQPPRVRGAAEFPGHDARAAPDRGRIVVAPAVGRGAAGRALLQAHPRRRQPRDRRRPRRARTATSPDYNIWMHHLVDAKGQRLFPAKQRLLAHWNLRDQIKADYADKQNGLARQRQIAQVMDRIVTQTIPDLVVDNPHVDWDPVTNAVKLSTVKDFDAADAARHEDLQRARARHALRHAALDASRPRARPIRTRRLAPTLIARRFDETARSPRRSVRAMLEAGPLLAARAEGRGAHRVAPRPPARAVRRLVHGLPASAARTRRSSSTRSSASGTRRAEAYKADIPNLLVHLGFSKEKADYLAAHIVVDPARGSGHALGAQRRADQAHLRTRVEKDGMNYKGFNIAVHEMGHNVEQTFSLNDVDSTLLQGVPNTAFTEALAFVFQAHDLELLGLAKPDAKIAGPEDAQRLLGHVRDRRRRARGHGRLALDVRPPAARRPRS